jgi:uncharacterized membrane protein YgcG
MKVNSRKNRKLIKQFPFIVNILKLSMLPNGTNFRLEKGPECVDGLTIRVQKADGDLLFRQAQNTGLGDYSMIFSMEDNRKDQVMRMGEYIFAIDDRNAIINRLDWPLNDQQATRRYPVYAKNVFWAKTSPGGNILSDPIWNKVAYLVWVTVEAWHKDTKVDGEPESRFGECLERNIRITVYGKPDCGFEELYEKSSIWSNLRLNQRVTTRSIIDKDVDLLQILGCHEGFANRHSRGGGAHGGRGGGGRGFGGGRGGGFGGRH